MALQNDDNNSDNEPDLEMTQRRPATWRERHALKLLGVVMAAMFALVIIVQVGC